MQNPYKDLVNLKWLVYKYIARGDMTARRFSEAFGYELSAVERSLRTVRDKLRPKKK